MAGLKDSSCVNDAIDCFRTVGGVRYAAWMVFRQKNASKRTARKGSAAGVLAQNCLSTRRMRKSPHKWTARLKAKLRAGATLTKPLNQRLPP